MKVHTSFYNDDKMIWHDVRGKERNNYGAELGGCTDGKVYRVVYLNEKLSLFEL